MINPLLGPFRCLWSVLYLYFGWTTTEFVWKWTKTHLFKGLSACLVHTMVQMANEWDSSSIYTFVLSDCRTSQTLHFCVLFVLLSNNTYETNIQYTVGVLWARTQWGFRIPPCQVSLLVFWVNGKNVFDTTVAVVQTQTHGVWEERNGYRLVFNNFNH